MQYSSCSLLMFSLEGTDGTVSHFQSIISRVNRNLISLLDCSFNFHLPSVLSSALLIPMNKVQIWKQCSTNLQMIKIQKGQQISLIKESRFRKSMRDLNNGPNITN